MPVREHNPERAFYPSNHAVFLSGFFGSAFGKALTETNTPLAMTDRINNAKGYSSVLICTAKEVLEDEHDN